MADSGMTQPGPVGRSLHTLLRVSLLAALIGPALLISIVGAAFYVSSELADARGRLEDAAASIAHQTQSYLRVHWNAVGMAARLTSAGRIALDDPLLVERLRQDTPGFLTTFAATADGRVVAASPDRTPDGARLTDSGADVSDRRYFREAVSSRRPYVSNGFQGRGFGSDPVVAVVWPVAAGDGSVAGVLEGSLDLQRLQGVVDDFARMDGLQVTLLDRQGRVVFDSYGSASPLAAWSPGEGMMLGGAEVAGFGWRTVVTQPTGAVLADALQFLAGALLLVAVGVVLALVAAARLARRVVRPLDQLVDRADSLELGEALESGVAANAPVEVQRLAGSFERMSARLRRRLSGIIPICAGCKKIRREDGEWEQLEIYIGRRSEADFSHGFCPDCARAFLDG